MEIVTRDIAQLEVAVTRKITVGQKLRINPSEAWLGIESGIIKIVSFGTKDELEDYEDYLPEGTINRLENEYDNFLDIDLDSKERLDTQPWVVYTYLESGDTATLPLEEFIDHTMHY